eukprot:354884-Chlamydomonas_euryale.AAC.4
MPLSFALPEEIEEWRAWLMTAQQQRATPTVARVHGDGGGGGIHSSRSGADRGIGNGGGVNGRETAEQLWMLKTGQDAGRGLRLLRADEALAAAEAEAAALREAGGGRGDGGSRGGVGGGSGEGLQKHSHQLKVAQVWGGGCGDAGAVEGMRNQVSEVCWGGRRRKGGRRVERNAAPSVYLVATWSVA